MNDNITTMFATGGLGAAMVAGWNQVKSFFNYVSSVIILRADLDYTLTPAMRSYLKSNYKPLPSGLLTYVGRKLPIKSTNKTAIVPFRVNNRSTVYYGKGHFVFVKDSSNMNMVGIRGLVNFNKLISQAIDFYEAQCRVEADLAPSRFQVHKVIGSEKGFSAANHRDYDKDEAPRGEAISSDSDWKEVDLAVDRSFKYDRELYTFTKNDDPLQGLFFDDDILDYFDQAQQWMEMSDWYAERKIPWRRGWLMHGPGGTGKSSIAKAVAQKLRIPIYQYFLATLSDQEFLRKWENMSTPCIALFEDFDNIFKKREPLTEHKSLTFDCVLNQISGVSSMNGVFLMVTTNRLEYIDEAMGVECDMNGVSTRPGRIDSVFYVGMINRGNRHKMAQMILKDWPEEIDQLVDSEEAQNVTPIQFQEMCIQRAFNRLAHQNGPRSKSNVGSGTEVEVVLPG